MFGPVAPKIGPTGPKISIVIVIGPDSAEPGLLLLLCASSLRNVAIRWVIYPGAGATRDPGTPGTRVHPGPE